MGVEPVVRPLASPLLSVNPNFLTYENEDTMVPRARCGHVHLKSSTQEAEARRFKACLGCIVISCFRRQNKIKEKVKGKEKSITKVMDLW